MVDTRYLEEIVVFLINLSGCLLAVWVYLSDKKGELNRWFTVMTFFVVMWVDSAFLANRARDVLMATTLYRLNFVFVSLFLISFYYFYVIHFFNAKRQYIFWGKIISFTGIVFAGIAFFTGMIVSGTTIQQWGADLDFGKGNLFFDLYATGVSILVIDFTRKRYIHLSKGQKMKVQYFSVGILFFVLFNVVFNIILPIIINTVEYARYGDYSAMILLAFTAYAITKNNLMGVKTLLSQVIVIVMAIVLAVDVIFFSNNAGMQLVKAGILIAFLYFGQELIKSVKKEKEVTEKIERANLNLAQRNKDLHILLEASGKTGQELDSRKISQDVVDSIPTNLKYLGFTFGVIALYDIEKDCLYVYAVTDSPLTRKIESVAKVHIDKFREHLSTHDDFIVRTIKNKKIYTSDKMEYFFGGFMDEKKNREVQRIIKAKSFISIPLFSSGQVMGAIILSNEKSIDDVTERSKDIVCAFASHIGSSIENAQLYEKTNSQMKELSNLNRDLSGKNVKLKELLEMKNDFLHITSHQLRTPMTAIRGMISMWIDGDFDKLSKAKKKEMLGRIYSSTERLNNITNDMLDALELEGGVAEIKFQRISVVKMIKDAVETLKPEFDKKGLYVRIGIKGEIPEVEAEPNYMAQVFMNLIDNACKYTREGGVEITVSASNKYVNIVISDTGIGVDPEEKGRLFEKFTRGSNAMIENTSGSGLGLFVVKKVLDEHNGKIVIKSKGLGEGTTFEICLLINQGKKNGFKK